MRRARLFIVQTPANNHNSLDMQAEDIARVTWRKSSLSTYNGSCVEIARLTNDRIGVRDTKDQGAGPVLAFTQNEWIAFLAGAKAGEFDSI